VAYIQGRTRWEAGSRSRLPISVVWWVERRCAKIVSIGSVRGASVLAFHLQHAPVRRPHATLHTVSETALGQHLIRVYALEPEIIRVDSTTSSRYAHITPDGLLQFGQSKDQHPDLPQLKVQLSAPDSFGLPLASMIVSGEQTDDLLSVPEVKKVQKIVKRHGLLSVGDSKMAAQATRAYVVSGDYSLCPLPAVQLDESKLRALLAPVPTGCATRCLVAEPGSESMRHCAPLARRQRSVRVAPGRSGVPGTSLRSHRRERGNSLRVPWDDS
jgi:hypothetical protein